MATAQKVEIRWATRRELAQVSWLDFELFDFPFVEEDFKRYLKARNTVLLVAEAFGAVQGYLLYEDLGDRFHIIRLGVRRLFQRMGIGTALTGRLKAKLDDRRTRITVAVRETNLGAQMFLRECGFRAVKVLRAYFPETDEDAYWFEYRMEQS